MRRLVLVLPLLLLGCDSASGPEYTDPDDLALAIVAGDGQVGAVRDGAASAYIIAAAPPAGTLPDTLIAKITDKSGGNANIGPNTLAEYRVTKNGCGRPWIATASPDDSAMVRTLWESPAGKLPDLGWHTVDGSQVWASECPMETRTYVDGEFAVSATFTAYFTPGAVDPKYEAAMGLARSAQPRTIPPSAHLALDRYDNLIPSCPVFDEGSAVTTAGPDWPACRDISWPEELEGFHTFRVLDMNGVQVGHGRYNVAGGALYLYAYGMDNTWAT